MTNCYIGKTSMLREWFDSTSDEVDVPYVYKTCCKSFEEDFDSDCVLYDIDIDEEGNSTLLATYDGLCGDKQMATTEEVKVCPYCGAKILIIKEEE